MKTITSVLLSFMFFVFLECGYTFAATEVKNAPQIMNAECTPKNGPAISNAIAIKNDTEKLAKESKAVVIAIDPVPYYSNLELVVYKNKIDLVDKTSNTVLDTYSTKNAVDKRIMFLDINLGRDPFSGMQRTGNYLIDLKQPDKVIALPGQHYETTTSQSHRYLVYEINKAGSYSIGIYDLKAKTNTIKSLPTFGFTGFLKFSPDGKYLLASSSVNTIYAIPLKTTDPIMYLNLPVPNGGHPTDSLTTKAAFIGKDEARLTLANGQICIIKIANSGITLLKGPISK